MSSFAQAGASRWLLAALGACALSGCGGGSAGGTGSAPAVPSGSGQPAAPTASTPSPAADGFPSRRMVNIASAAALTDFQVALVVPWETGMSQDFANIRFYASDRNTELPYFIADAVAGRSANVFVRVPAIANGASSIVLAFGKADVGSASDGRATFDFYDDFAAGSIASANWTSVTGANEQAIASRIETVSLFRMPGFGGQGIYGDGTNIWVTRNNGDQTPSTVFKLTYSGSNPLGGATPFGMGPPHGASIDGRDDRGTLLASSGGTLAAEVWELNRATGARLRSWKLGDVDYGRGTLLAYYRAGQILLVTSSPTAPYAFKVREVTLNDDGSYVIGRVWASDGLGVPQGLEWKDDRLYYLVDAPNGTGTLFKLALNSDGTLTNEDSWDKIRGIEREGLSFDGTNWLYGTSEYEVYRIAFDAGYAARLYGSRNPGRAAYIASARTFAAPVVIGTRARLNGRFPGALWLADGTGANLPVDSANLIGLGRLGTPNLTARQRIDGTQTDVDYPNAAAPDTTHRYEARWSGSDVTYAQDGVALGGAQRAASGSLRLLIGGNTGDQSASFSVSAFYAYARKFALAEPTAVVGPAL